MPLNPGETTLATVRTSAKRRCDMVNSSVISDAEWNEYIAGSLFELYDLLVTHYGSDWYEKASPYTFTTTSAETYALPSDFYRCLGVEIYDGSSIGGWRRIDRFDRSEGSGVTIGTPGAPWFTRYRLAGSYIALDPVPNAGTQLRLRYVPRLTAPTADTDVIDGVSGWEEYIVLDVCIKAMLKQQMDAGGYGAQKGAMLARIQSTAGNRDAGTAPTVADASGLADRYENRYRRW